MFKRIFLFMLTNILVIVTITTVMKLLGVGPYITAYGLNYQSLAIFCLLWGMIGSGISLLMSKFMAKMMMGVQIIEPGNAQFSGLVNAVHQYAKAAGLNKMPEVGVYDSPEVNAFATGPSKNNSLVAVSTGLLQRMDTAEVEGVLAHEIAHIKNGDMVTMALVQGVINAFVMFFARIAAFAVAQALRGDNDREGGIGMFAQWGLIILFEIAFGFLGMFVIAFFSRFREYRADAGGARIAGKDKMIAALQRLKQNFEMVDDSQASFRSMKISSKKGLMSFLSTHPSLDDRIAALQKSY